jgi:hypothetical protein
MKRKYKDSIIEVVKRLMAEGYKTSSIIDIIEKKFKVIITSSVMQSIRSGVSYHDVSPHLSEQIMAYYKINTSIDQNRIEEIKWALANDYSEEDISEVFNVSKKEMCAIKMCVMPYYQIAPHLNAIIKNKWSRRKNVNIDRSSVISIKKEYIINNGEIKLDLIAKKHNIDKGTVSNILNLKSYINEGISLNSKINSIKKDKERKSLREKKAANKKKLENERVKINLLKQKRQLLLDKVRISEKKIQVIMK